jgi:hypothetical protein
MGITLKLTVFHLKQTRIDAFLAEIERFRQVLLESACPSCGEKGLKLVSYTQGLKGWNCVFICLSCLTKAEFNDSGFQVELSEQTKEKAKDKEQKKK